jgi:uncharacterized ferritin-like protein (DUF455 family)
MTQTLASWALDYVTSTSLATKLTRVPRVLTVDEGPRLAVPNAPGRPAELVLTQKAAKAPGPEAMRAPEKRAQLVHTFLHHELQAAELMAWATLRFADAPTPFLRGLAKIADDEIRHMQMYADYLAKLGFAFGDFPVRDWFWERVPSAPDARAFLATFGMGFEAGNLDHTRRFAERFRAIGDDEGARLQEVVGEEEVPHVKFAVFWYARFAGEPAFDTWASSLPSPLSPMLMRGKPLDREARLRAGFSETFLDELEAWQPNASGI